MVPSLYSHWGNWRPARVLSQRFFLKSFLPFAFSIQTLLFFQQTRTSLLTGFFLKRFLFPWKLNLGSSDPSRRTYSFTWRPNGPWMVGEDPLQPGSKVPDWSRAGSTLDLFLVSPNAFSYRWIDRVLVERRSGPKVLTTRSSPSQEGRNEVQIKEEARQEGGVGMLFLCRES